MRYFLALLLIIPSITFADSIQLTWDTPTQRVDGAALLPSEIDGYVIKHWQNGDKMPDIVVDGALTVESLLPDIQPGSYIFSIATTAQGQTGPDSDLVSVNIGGIPVVAPSAPAIRVQLVCDPACSLEVK